MHSDTPVALPIEFHEVTHIRGEMRALDRVSLKIDLGTPTVLIGPNGSGKTTLLRLAMGMLTPNTGYISWGEHARYPSNRTAFVFQRPTMLRRTVTENLRYALRAAQIPRGEEPKRTDQLLTMVGLEALGDRPARSLSGGEQQRVALARALAGRPEVLMLDEPTASLDPAAAKIVEDLLRVISEDGIKIIMSTHDLGEARRLAGDIILLHQGRLIERSLAADFFRAPRTREAAVFLAGDLLL